MTEIDVIMAIGRSLLEAAPALFLLYYWGL